MFKMATRTVADQGYVITNVSILARIATVFELLAQPKKQRSGQVIDTIDLLPILVSMPFYGQVYCMILSSKAYYSFQVSMDFVQLLCKQRYEGWRRTARSSDKECKF